MRYFIWWWSWESHSNLTIKDYIRRKSVITIKLFKTLHKYKVSYKVETKIRKQKLCEVNDLTFSKYHLAIKVESNLEASSGSVDSFCENHDPWG